MFLTAFDGGKDKSGTFYGPSQPMGNGSMRAYTTLDQDGNPSVVGVRMTEAALAGLPEQSTESAPMTMLALPAQASATPFQHVMVNWNSHGHPPPGIFDKPHFDVHFYMSDMASLDDIDPAKPDYGAKADKLPPAQYIPKDYQVPWNLPGQAFATPGMGSHLVDGKLPLIPGVFQFTSVVLNGTWNGEYTFLEPMMTREYLLTKPTLHQPIEQPQAYKFSGYFPTTYDLSYDSSSGEYDIALGAAQMRHAS